MITYKCDVCGKSASAPTALWEMRSCPPLGWLLRRGLAPTHRGKHEVQVIVCSEACSGAYDVAESEQVGAVWTKIVVTTNDDEDFEGVFPVKVGKRRG